MIKRNNMRMTALTMAIGLSLLTGCGAQTVTPSKEETVVNNTTIQAVTAETSDVSVSFKEDDYYADWSNGTFTKLTLDGTTISTEGSGVEVNGSIVTIKSGGTYVVSGNLSDGQIIVDSQDETTVRLILNGAEVHSSSSSPVYVKQAKKVVLSLEEGTTNTFTDSDTYTLEEGMDEPDATIFSKDDLTINGTGTLVIKANYNNGLTSKDKLKVVEGNLTIDAMGDGIKGKDVVAIKDGTIQINATEDGIKATNSTETDKGFVYIEGGDITIVAGNDGIQAETDIRILGGSFDLNTGGGSNNGAAHTEESFGGKGGFGMTRPTDAGTTKPVDEGMTPPTDEGTTQPSGEGMMPPPDAGTTKPSDEGMVPPPDANATEPSDEIAAVPTTPANETSEESLETDTTSETSDSYKGLKAVNNITIDDGIFQIDSADDALHSNNSLVINGGQLNLASGDDGIHADSILTINGGLTKVTKSYEGLEAAEININGGTTYITASDDGVNATDGSGATGMGVAPGSSGSNSVKLNISGGYLNVDASGDGLDSNGSIYMTDGTVIVNGPTNGGNGALDYDTSFEVSGGTLAVAGSAQMAQTVSSTSTQRAVSITLSMGQEAGSDVAILDESGNVIISFAPAKTYQAVTICSPLLEEGKTYTFVYGGVVSSQGEDGLVQEGTYSGGTKVCDFTISEEITYLNESGVTTGGSNGMFGGGGKGGRGNKTGDWTTKQQPAETTQSQTAS